MVGQVPARHRLAVGQRARALDDVLQLPHVARPAVALERGHGVVVDAADAPLSVALEEGVGEQAHVPRPVAQRRQLDRDDVDAVVELLAELPLDGRLPEVAVGRRDHAHVHVHEGRPADAADLTLLQRAQQLHLKPHGHLGDLVEEERAVVGDLHEARLAAHRAGEGALLVAEELGLEQVLRQRGAVHRDEGLRRPRAVGVDGAGDQLLAGAGLAQHEDVGLGPGGLLDKVEDARHGLAAADDALETEGFLQLLAEILVLDLEVPLAERPLDRDAEVLHGEVLGQVVSGAFLHRGHGRLDGGEGRDDDDGQRRVELVRALEQHHAVHARHLEVRDEEVRPLLFEQRKGLARLCRGEALVPDAAQDARAVLEHVGLVVHDQHSRRAHTCPPAAARAPETGKVKMNVVPSPGRDSTSTVPW